MKIQKYDDLHQYTKMELLRAADAGQPRTAESRIAALARVSAAFDPTKSDGGVKIDACGALLAIATTASLLRLVFGVQVSFDDVMSAYEAD